MHKKNLELDSILYYDNYEITRRYRKDYIQYTLHLVVYLFFFDKHSTNQTNDSKSNNLLTTTTKIKSIWKVKNKYESII